MNRRKAIKQIGLVGMLASSIPLGILSQTNEEQIIYKVNFQDRPGGFCSLVDGYGYDILYADEFENDEFLEGKWYRLEPHDNEPVEFLYRQDPEMHRSLLVGVSMSKDGHIETDIPSITELYVKSGTLLAYYKLEDHRF